MPMKKTDRQFIRLDLDPESHKVVRLAAAHLNISLAEFARQHVVEAARKVNDKSK